MSVDVVGKRVKSVCSFCGGDCERSERFDAYLCAKCNKWIERACADKACEFCVERPEVPFSSSSITIEIPGAPVPSMRKRARAVRTKAGKTFVKMYSPKGSLSATYFEKVALFAGIAAQRAGWKVEEKATYYVHFEIHRATLRGDFDNFEKAITDPMNGIIWKDDAQITEWGGVLLLDRKNPRAIVRVERRSK